MKYFKTLFITTLLCLSTITVWAASQEASGTDASVIITNARAYLNEPSAVVWSDAELLVHVNSGTMDIVTRTHCLEGTKAQLLVAGTASYSLSAEDYIFIQAVVLDIVAGGDKGLTRGNLQSIGHVGDGGNTGQPIYWTQEQSNIIVYPTPDAGDTIDIYYVKRPAAVLSSADVLVPACYDRALTLYVVAQAFYKDGKFAKAGRFMAEYLAELDRFRSDFVTVPKESDDIIR